MKTSIFTEVVKRRKERCVCGFLYLEWNTDVHMLSLTGRPIPKLSFLAKSVCAGSSAAWLSKTRGKVAGSRIYTLMLSATAPL